MPALPRKTQSIFGAALVAGGNVAQFGSLLAGAPAYSLDLAAIQTAAWLQGLAGCLIGNRSPAKEDLNGVLLVVTQQIAYLLQNGLAEYDPGTTYFQKQWSRGSDGNPYVSLSDNNVGNDPTTDSNNWGNLFGVARGPGLCLGWAEFDGINATAGNSIIHASFNVDHIVKNLDGSYTVVFIDPLPSTHYAIGGSCGSEDGQPYGAGDDGVVVGNVAGQGNAIRSATQCRIFTINPTNKALVASGDVSVFFFGR